MTAMPARHPSDLEHQIAHRLDALQRELGAAVPHDHLLAVGSYHTQRLLAHATITDFIPLLVYRFTKEELLSADGVHRAVSEAA